MPLQIPTRREEVARLQAYVRSDLPELDPTTGRRSFIGGFVKSLGSALHDWYVKLKRYADNEPFPQTASRDFLLYGWWRDVTKLAPNPAAAATGKVVITGTAGTILPAGSSISGASADFTTTAAAAVVTQNLIAASLTRSGSTAIFETLEPHYLADGMLVTFSGADQADYNVTATITVTADNEITYTVAGTPTTPATGSPNLSGAWGNVDIVATAAGQSGNVDAGQSLTIDSPPSGLDGTARVTFGAIAGGTEAETTESYRARVLQALGTDFGTFTGDEIEIIAKSVPGVTRVFVRRATLNGTNGVYEGQVKIAFMRDGDANPFPSGAEVGAVKSKILALAMPAHTAEEDVVVESPTPLPVAFTFTALIPNTASMRRAVEARLAQFFREGVGYGEDITEDDYRCAIKDTYDRESGSALKSFALSAPTGDISVGAGEMPTLGVVTFSA